MVKKLEVVNLTFSPVIVPETDFLGLFDSFKFDISVGKATYGANNADSLVKLKNNKLNILFTVSTVNCYCFTLKPLCIDALHAASADCEYLNRIPSPVFVTDVSTKSVTRKKMMHGDELFKIKSELSFF